MRLFATCALATVAATATAASGDVIISNIEVPPTTGTVFGDGCANTIFKAAGFAMPSGREFSLDLVRLHIDHDWSSGGQLGEYSVWEGASTPTTRVATLEPVDPQVGLGVFDFAPTEPFTLRGDTTYWIYVEKDPLNPGGCMLWSSPPTSSGMPSGIATHVAYIFNGSPSSFWNNYEVRGTPAATCYPDCNDDGVLDFFDFLCFQNAFLAQDPYADCDGNQTFDFFDFLCFQNEFLAGCP